MIYRILKTWSIFQLAVIVTIIVLFFACLWFFVIFPAYQTGYLKGESEGYHEYWDENVRLKVEIEKIKKETR